MRPWVSVSGTRCTRCTPDSNFSLANAPRPFTSAMISLKPPMVPSLAEITSTFQPCKTRKALIHPEQVAGEQCRLVAAGAGADFQHDVALVHGVLGQQRHADLLRQLEAAGDKRLALGLRHAAHLGFGRGIRYQRLGIGNFLVDGAVGLHRVDQRIELGQFARDPHVVFGVHLAKHLCLEGSVVRQQDIEFGFRKYGHELSLELRAHSAKWIPVLRKECAPTI